MTDLTILGIAGALRRASTNRLLLAEALRVFGPAVRLEGDLRMPLYDGDLEDEQGIPPEAQRLADQIREADCVVIATPEYNRSIPGGLKNALDWVSRTKGGVWRDKPLAIISAADGRPGGARSQFALRLSMVTSRAAVLPAPEVLIGDSSHAFDADGRLIDPRAIKVLTELMVALRTEAEKRRA